MPPVKIRFFGTRGYVEESSPTHRFHSAFSIEAEGFTLLCDFGENQVGRLSEIRPDAIVLSHAHPDHAWGLKDPTSIPVYASAATHAIIRDFPVGKPVSMAPGRRRRAGPFRLTLLPVAHSVRCPCTAVRIEGEGKTLLVAFPDPAAALSGVDLYVGDGSTLAESLVRRHKTGALIGHTTVRAQLGWLGRSAVPRAIFAHFGKGPIELGDGELRARVAALAVEKAPGCRVEIATDGAEYEA
jgi:glyoxylase-like metal-dependent hydrolase (beta-lactamase superfamily II)